MTGFWGVWNVPFGTQTPNEGPRTFPRTSPFETNVGTLGARHMQAQGGPLGPGPAGPRGAHEGHAGNIVKRDYFPNCSANSLGVVVEWLEKCATIAFQKRRAYLKVGMEKRGMLLLDAFTGNSEKTFYPLRALWERKLNVLIPGSDPTAISEKWLLHM